MKILIVGIVRSGTTSLMNAFRDQEFFKISEPYNYDLWKKIKWSYPPIEIFNKKNIIVKTLVNQVPESYENSWISFIKEFIKYFDKIMYINRKDSKSHWESYMNLHYKKANDKSYFSRWKIEDIPQNIIYDLNNSDVKKDFDLQNKMFCNLTDNLNQTVTWYEDLYGEDRNKSLDIIKSWNLNIDVNKMNQDLHPSKKLRQFGKKSVI